MHEPLSYKIPRPTGVLKGGDLASVQASPLKVNNWMYRVKPSLLEGLEKRLGQEGYSLLRGLLHFYLQLTQAELVIGDLERVSHRPRWEGH